SSPAENTGFQQCRLKNCRPFGRPPSPEPTFHAHVKDTESGDVSAGFWGPIDGPAAAKARLEVTTRASVRRKKRRLGTGGEAAAAGAAPAMEGV
ncbi:unnamed protein product, partial [Ectocarpus sp. 13 AM-2016]